MRLVVTLTEAGGTLGCSDKLASSFLLQQRLRSLARGRRTHLGCGVWAVSEMAIEEFSIWELFLVECRIASPNQRETVSVCVMFRVGHVMSCVRNST